MCGAAGVKQRSSSQAQTFSPDGHVLGNKAHMIFSRANASKAIDTCQCSSFMQVRWGIFEPRNNFFSSSRDSRLDRPGAKFPHMLSVSETEPADERLKFICGSLDERDLRCLSPLPCGYDESTAVHVEQTAHQSPDQ